jgi:hypothetical protein
MARKRYLLIFIPLVLIMAIAPGLSRAAGREVPEAPAGSKAAPATEAGETERDTASAKHLSIESADGNWLMEFGALAQFRYEYAKFDHGDTTSDFSLNTLRPYIQGHVFDKNLEYYMEFEFGQGDNELLEAYVDWVKNPTFSFRAGQMKVPYGRQFPLFEGNLQFADRGIATNYFAMRPDGYDIGFMMHGKSKEGMFETAIGLFNGSGKNRFNDNKYPMFAGRIGVNPNGHFYPCEADIQNHQKMVASFGGSFLYNRYGTLVADQFDEMRFGLDFASKYKGFSTQAEFFYSHDNWKKIGIPSLNQDGWYIQAGYFLRPQHHELAFRWSVIDPDRDTSNDWKSEYTFGYNYYNRGHRYKIQIDYSFLRSKYPNQTYDDQKLTAQVQVWI